MKFFTFFNNHKRDEVAEAELDAALEEVKNESTKPFIKPQRLATIIEMNEVEHFEQPPQEEENTNQ